MKLEGRAQKISKEMYEQGRVVYIKGNFENTENYREGIKEAKEEADYVQRFSWYNINKDESTHAEI
jgi:hypothetical protein